MLLSFTQAEETGSGDMIFSHSGVLLSSAMYESTSNAVTLRFTTDSTTNQYGWKVYWEEVLPPVETTSTSTSTTTPACESYIKSSFRGRKI